MAISHILLLKIFFISILLSSIKHVHGQKGLLLKKDKVNKQLQFYFYKRLTRNLTILIIKSGIQNGH